MAPQASRLYLCDGGSTEIPLGNHIMGAGRNGEMVVTPVTFYVITHPRGNIVIDGGNAPEVAIDAKAHWGAILEQSNVYMSPDQALLPTLERLGIDTESVRWILQSHLHIDHTGAVAVIDQLPNAQVLCTRTEYEWAHAPDGFSAIGYCHADFVKEGIDWVLLEDFEDGWDLYGDGSLRCWYSPGHSPGHMSFEVTLSSGASFLLTVDAASTLDHVNEIVNPGFSLDNVTGARSVRRLRRLAERSSATIIPGHDPDFWPTLKRAPEYYS